MLVLVPDKSPCNYVIEKEGKLWTYLGSLVFALHLCHVVSILYIKLCPLHDCDSSVGSLGASTATLPLVRRVRVIATLVGRPSLSRPHFAHTNTKLT